MPSNMEQEIQKKIAYININLIATKNLLDFKVENSFQKPTKKIKEQIGGIGLTNLKKRLEINYGPEYYNLKHNKGKK